MDNLAFFYPCAAVLALPLINSHASSGSEMSANHGDSDVSRSGFKGLSNNAHANVREPKAASSFLHSQATLPL
jgi:hypothetical protein